MISLIVVNYRTAELAAGCIDSARRVSRRPLQVIVVDNSEDEGEAARLRPLADAFLAPATNSGYAAAINAGRKLATGDVLMVSNPDVVFGSGSIDVLAAAVETSAAVAGPALFWDDAYRWLLPPADLNSTSEKLDQIAASRLPLWPAWRDRRRIRHRLRFWQTIETVPVRAVSGAVMAIRTDAFDRVGAFDERFRLYFEEIDFMRRIAKSGHRIVYTPAARCRHVYNQSAGRDPRSAETLYAASERAYLERWSSRPLSAAFRKLQRAPVASESLPLSPDQPIEIDFDDALVEASPLATFETAAGHFPPRGKLELPAEILSTYRGQALYLRVIDCRSARVRATYVLEMPTPAQQ